MSTLPVGVYQTVGIPWWLVDVSGSPANILASTVTINSVPNGNITMTHAVSSSTEFNAPIIFQRPPTDINAPSESLVMNTSTGVPTKPVDGEYITATKAAGTVYDDIAVAGLQVYGNQTTAGNSGAIAYITGCNGDLILAAQNSVYVSSLVVSTFTATNVVSTATAASFTATVFMSTPIMNTNVISSLGISTGVLQAGQLNILQNINTPSISTNTISTSQIVSKDVFTSTLTVSTLNAPNFVPSTVTTSTINSVFSDTKFSLTSTLSLFGNVDVNLGLGNQIAGLIGGAGGQALGVSLGGAGLITGAAALVSGRTSGGVNNSIFQTVNGSTQLQFSTIGSNVSSIFLTTNSPNPFTTPGLEIQQSQGVPAGTYCVRSVGDPLYINNNVSSIQMFGQWVPVIQPTATIPALAISSLGVSTSQSVTGNVSSLFVSSVNGAVYPPPSGAPTIPSTIALSTATFLGNVSSIGAGTFTWGANTITPTQVTLNRPTAVNNTLTTTGAAFLNAGATVNSGLTVASGGANVTGGLTVASGNVTVNNSLFVLQILQGQTVQATGSLSVGGGGVSIVGGGINMAAGNLTMTNPTSVANITNVNVSQNLVASQLVRANAISTNQISTNNINVNTINNQTYPPPSGSTQIPSTLNASTINFDGGLNNVGSAPIITNTITTTNANVNFYIGNAINAGSISSTTISTNTVQAGTIATNTTNTNILSTNLVRAGAISSFSMSTNTLIVNTINGQPYTPGGGGGIPSTLNASTINVNGGINIANGGIINSSFEPIRTGFLSTNFISTGLITADTLRSDFVSSGTVTANIMGTFNFSTIRGSINALTASTISTQGINAVNTQSAAISTNQISTNNLVALNGNVRSLAVSSINGTIYPPLSYPTGGVTVWAGTNGLAPTGWLICDGKGYSRTTYADLYSVIGNSYYNRYPIAPDPSLFYVPDMTWAIPQAPPPSDYEATFSFVSYLSTISGFPAPTVSNAYLEIKIGSPLASVPSGFLNVGSYIYPGQFPGQTSGFYIYRVLDTINVNDPSSTGYTIPRVIEIRRSDNPSCNIDWTVLVPTQVKTRGAFNYPGRPGFNPYNYWYPGTYNDLYTVTSPTTDPPRDQQQLLFNTLDPWQIPAHVHNGVPSVASTALGGASLLAGASGNPGTATSVQTNASYLANSTITGAFPTKPNIINMYYIIRT